MEKDPLILFLCTPYPNMCGLQKKPEYMYEKIPSKETYICEKRPQKRLIHVYEKRHIHMKRDLYIWKFSDLTDVQSSSCIGTIHIDLHMMEMIGLFRKRAL